jgi:hypothetical protein
MANARQQPRTRISDGQRSPCSSSGGSEGKRRRRLVGRWYLVCRPRCRQHTPHDLQSTLAPRVLLAHGTNCLARTPASCAASSRRSGPLSVRQEGAADAPGGRPRAASPLPSTSPAPGTQRCRPVSSMAAGFDGEKSCTRRRHTPPPSQPHSPLSVYPAASLGEAHSAAPQGAQRQGRRRAEVLTAHSCKS